MHPDPTSEPLEPGILCPRGALVRGVSAGLMGRATRLETSGAVVDLLESRSWAGSEGADGFYLADLSEAVELNGGLNRLMPGGRRLDETLIQQHVQRDVAALRSAGLLVAEAGCDGRLRLNAVRSMYWFACREIFERLDRRDRGHAKVDVLNSIAHLLVVAAYCLLVPPDGTAAWTLAYAVFAAALILTEIVTGLIPGKRSRERETYASLRTP